VKKKGGKRIGAGRPFCYSWREMEVGQKFAMQYKPYPMVNRYNKKLAPKVFRAYPVYVKNFRTHYEIERIL